MKLKMPAYAKARVVIVGDVMLDRYWHGPTSRISPEAPVPVVRVDSVEDRPGGAANVALNVAALGAAAVLVGIVGNDDAGEALAQRMEAAGILASFEKNPDIPTITKLRVISRQQQLIRLDFEDAMLTADGESLAALVNEQLGSTGAIILSDYGKGALSDPQPLIQLGRQAGVPVMIDPKGTDFERYRGATLLTPNMSEFEGVVGHCRNEKEIINKGLKLMRDLELDALLITRSEHGMTLLREGEPELHFPAQAKEVYDVTGAGDTVISVLAASYASAESLQDSVALSNIAAAIVVGKLGTAAISAPELKQAIYEDQGAELGAMSSEQVAVAVAAARARGERIVFTNGCFDIVHAGHVGYLEQARKLGDRLVVAVNGDDSVARLKGPGRPINPVDRRMAVLAGLEAVDWVVSFEEDTPEGLLQLIRPDVLVKGGDYSLDEVVGAPIVRSYGGEIRVVDFLDNLSTTAIVNQIQRKAN